MLDWCCTRVYCEFTYSVYGLLKPSFALTPSFIRGVQITDDILTVRPLDGSSKFELSISRLLMLPYNARSSLLTELYLETLSKQTSLHTLLSSLFLIVILCFYYLIIRWNIRINVG